MRSYKLRTLLLLAATTLTLAAVAEFAVGHSYDVYYAQGTYPGRPHQERVFFGRDAPVGAFRDRFMAAQNQWDNITSRFQFILYRDDVDANAPRRCSRKPPEQFGQSASVIDYQYIDGRGDAQADTLTCSHPDSGRLDYFALTVDTADEIYFGRQDAPEKSADLASIAVHEFGHAAGFFFHYDDPETTNAANESLCRNNSDQLTMCSKLFPGTERQRTLQDHDRDTHAAAYNR